MDRFRIYLAGSISGKSYDEVVAYYKKVIKDLKGNFEILHPMTGKAYLRTEVQFREQGYDNPTATNHAIFERDKWMVNKADVILADLREATRVSIGSCMELAWASLLGKHTVIILPKENVHRHAFVLEAADIIFETYEEAIVYLAKLAKQEI